MAHLDAAVVELYKRLMQGKMCLCDTDEASQPTGMAGGGSRCAQGILGNLDEDTSERDAMKKRERALFGLTVGKQVFEVTHCVCVLHLQREIMGSSGSLLEKLGTLLSSEDRLTAFMSCQMAQAVLSSPAVDKEKAVSFLHHQLRGIGTVFRLVGHPGQANSPNPCAESQIRCSQNEVSKGHIDPDQVDLSPDDASRVHKDQTGSDQIPADQHHSSRATSGHETLGQSRDPGNDSKIKPDPDQSRSYLGQVNHAVFTFDLCRLLLKKIGDGGSRQVESENYGTTLESQLPCRQAEHSRCGRLEDWYKEVKHLLCEDLPCILHGLALPQQCDAAETVNADSNAGDITLIVASLLDLVHTLLKHRTADQSWLGFTSKLGPSLLNLFKDYCHDVIILKRILDIFVLFITDQSTSMSCGPHSGQSHSSHLITMATTCVGLVAKGSFLERIPYRSGPIGFGGGNFRPSDHGYESGDRPLLRKLYRATLCAVKTLLSLNSERNFDESEVASCLQHLWGYAFSKLNHVIPTDAHAWLVYELFSEQDDSLIRVMFCSLDLYKASQSVHPSDSLFVAQFNPHRIFRRFLDTVAYDPSVLLDLLISSETPFLEYLVAYLHTVLGDWDSFCGALREVVAAEPTSDSPVSSASVRPAADEMLCLAKHGHSSSHRVQDGIEIVETTKRQRTEVDGDGVLKTRRPTEPDYPSSQSSPSSKHGLTSNEPHQYTDGDSIKRTPKEVSEAKSGSPSTSTKDTLCDSPDNITSQPLDDVMTTLIRLRFSIERISKSHLFPYAISPLLRLLERVEDMYEGDIG